MVRFTLLSGLLSFLPIHHVRSGCSTPEIRSAHIFFPSPYDPMWPEIGGSFWGWQEKWGSFGCLRKSQKSSARRMNRRSARILKRKSGHTTWLPSFIFGFFPKRWEAARLNQINPKKGGSLWAIHWAGNLRNSLKRAPMSCWCLVSNSVVGSSMARPCSAAAADVQPRFYFYLSGVLLICVPRWSSVENRLLPSRINKFYWSPTESVSSRQFISAAQIFSYCVRLNPAGGLAVIVVFLLQLDRFQN